MATVARRCVVGRYIVGKYDVQYQYLLLRRSFISTRRISKRLSLDKYHERLRELIEPKYIVHFGNLLAVCAMLQSDMLYLRSFMIGASICGIAFNLLQPLPLITPAAWGCFFIAGHSIQIYFLIRDKLSITMSQDLNQVYEDAFFGYGFTPRQFIDLCNFCNYSFQTFKKGENIVTEGSDMPYLHWLYQGKLAVKTKKFGDLGVVDEKTETKWLGEFFDPNRDPNYWKNPHSWIVTYFCLEDCKVLRLNRKKLDIFLNQNDNFKEKASKVVIKDIWGKLRNVRKSDVLKSYTEMLNIALLTDEAALSEKVKDYLLQYAANNKIDKTYIEMCLKENHGLSYDELFSTL